ncbi:CRISPR-associated endonuclease Cas9 2 [Pedobacter glucosidilyticus]|nr:type II CRISPR RNA-guided endonuclease Cas9 [Pedobacter glucosidilyticus]KHJ36806.1 CRISPR-associated endonuclease Cas9 2 [Pedobacter glucosidilyticus]
MTKHILGLDLGTNSIGWAIIQVDNNNNVPIQIIAMGSRIIPLDSNDRDQFQKGQAISKNKDRTTARTQRKGYDRKQLKKSDDFKYSLKKILEKLDIFPTEELMKLPTLDLWKLRSDAVSNIEDITPKQLGRILYMLNQKRGYKSARSEANADKKDTDYVAEVKGRYTQLKDKGQTLGQYFYKELSDANQNNTYYRVKEKVYPREAYIEEFDAIINVQKSKHSFLTDEVIHSLRNEIIYYQRKLKSQKGLVSICEFEGFETTYFDKKTQQDKTIFTGPKVAPRTSPLFQFCKIWEVVNNISLKTKNPEGSKYKWSDRIPTIEEKQTIANYLQENENLSFIELLKILQLKKEQVYANKQILKGIQGNTTFSAIHKIIGNSEHLKFDIETIPSKHFAVLVDKKTGEILDERDSLELNSALEQEPFYQLWHTIYSIKDLDECKKALIKRFNFEEEIAEKLSKIDFNKQAFGNKSNKAMRKMLPYLMLGYNQSEAESFAGYNRRLTKEEKSKNVSDEPLQLLAKNSLRQPVVEKILNQMINVVNAIIEKYGKPEEIRVELARELKQSKDEREDADKQNGFNKKLNELVATKLTELGLPTTKHYIQKYKFIFPAKDKNWKEAQVANQCIYCGDTFNLTEALSGDNFDVDHIVPKALLFDDSQANKVLVHRSCNSTKTNNTAYDYITKKGSQALNDYVARVDDWFKRGIISYGKMQRLKVSFEEYQERKKIGKETEADKRIWENFIDRQLRETAYIAKKAKEILEKVCHNVTSTEGNVTAKLRQLWGWDNVLMNLQLPKYKELEKKTKQTFTQLKEWTSDHGNRKHQKEEIINWTKRDDHRHHAIDALVIACTQQGFIQRINTLSSSDVKDEMKKELEEDKTVYNERLTLLENYLLEKKPFSTEEIEKEADKILVSFKAGKKVATLSKYKATGINEIKGVLVPRGPLHEQSVYGKIKVIEKDKPLKYLFENSDKIVNPLIKHLVKTRLLENENNAQAALVTLKNKPILLNNKQTEILEKASCYNEATVLKYKLQSLKASQIDDIVDEKIKFLIKERLSKFGNKEKEAFKDILWFNEKKQIPITSIRLFARPDANNLQVIKKHEKGKNIGFVLSGNNHHIAIYEDKNNKLIQHICDFWHAVERKRNNIPVLIEDTSTIWNHLINEDFSESFLNKLPNDSLKLKFSLQQNEMFILGLPKEQSEEAIKSNNKSLLSKHLYLVWSITDGDYFFRHHLETKNTELKKIDGSKESKRYLRLSTKSLVDLNPIKVRLNHLGEITKIGE